MIPAAYELDWDIAHDLEATMRRVREGLLSLAKRYLYDPWAFEQAAADFLREQEPRLAEAVRVGQLRSFFRAAQSLLVGATAMDRLTKFGTTLDPPPASSGGGFELVPIADSQLAHTSFPVIDQGAKWLRSRIGYTPDEFKALDTEYKMTGFTVARQNSQEVIDRIGRSLAQAVESGATVRNWMHAVTNAVAIENLSNPQLETIFRTWTGKAYASGMRHVMRDPIVAAEFPYLLYSATHDSRVRPEHLQMERLGMIGTNGQRTAVYRADDPIWELFTPPWAWNCRCDTTPLSLEDAANNYGVLEAVEWLQSGVEPTVVEHVPWPEFRPPPGFVPVRF